MRLLLKLIPEKFIPSFKINKHTVQGGLYTLLDGTEFSDLHSKTGFKFFTFSDIFPPGDFYPNKEKFLIISSPNDKLINAFASRLKETKHFYLSDGALHVEIKTFRVKPTGMFRSGSPVVIQKDNVNSIYFSFQRGDSMRYFMDRLKENALKKYNAYYDDELYFEGDLFDLLQFRKEVSVVVKKEDRSFIIIGTVWDLLQKNIPKDLKKFYEFITDCGIGEKNSLGFGFLNIIKNKKTQGVQLGTGSLIRPLLLGCALNIMRL